MIQTTLDAANILNKAIFTLSVLSSSNPNTYDDTNIYGYAIGLNVEAVAVDNMKCILMDTEYFHRLDLIPYLDSNGKQETIELYDGNDKIIARYHGYTLYLYFFENGIFDIKKVICAHHDNLFQRYGTNILYGKGTPILAI